MMKPEVKASESDKYHEEAANWDADQVSRSKASEKRAWRVAGVAATGFLLSIGAIFAMMPLKTVEYRVIRIDTVTGQVDTLTTLKDGKETYGEATDKYWLRRYVRQREGWLFDEFKNNYREIGLLSSAAEQQKWFNFYKPENPSSPWATLGNQTRVRIKIKSVSFLGKGLANVAFAKITEQNNVAPRVTHWVAVIPYRYVNPPTKEDDRELNPLGFQVSEGYRVDPVSDVTTNTKGEPLQ